MQHGLSFIVIDSNQLFRTKANEIPSLFILDKGELMGLVTAVYNADTDSFSNVNVTYTTAGEAVNHIEVALMKKNTINTLF